jgi:hypothetical protein
MKSVKIKKSIPKNMKADMADLHKMFDQMMGTTSADVEIISPKYVKVKSSITDFCKVYDILINFKVFAEVFPECSGAVEEIKKFVENARKIDAEFKPQDGLNTEDLNKLWKTLKDNSIVKTIIATTGRLHKFKQFIVNHKELDDGFIKREPGLDMCLLVFSSLDLKLIWASDAATMPIKTFILNILSKTYNIGYEIYDLVTSPDIDIKKFSEVLVSAIESLKRQIPRCDSAFNVIADSVKLLENNFKNYYRASIQAENPMLIMENFVIDVSMKQKGGLQVMQQFKKIISHLKQSSAKNKDPRVKTLFDMLNKQFSMIDKQNTGSSGTINNDNAVPQAGQDGQDDN